MESTLFYGGKILTMEREGASAEALAVIDGKIAGIGSYIEMENLLQKQKKMMWVDLKGNTLMPGFIDPHSHLVQLASSLRFVNLADCHTHAEIRQKLTAYKTEERPAPGSWIIGFGYDHNILIEKQHPTKKVLDEVSTEHPVMVSHASGHMGVANSKALEALNITAFTSAPEGGLIGKMSGSDEPNGYLEENAFIQASNSVPTVSDAEMLVLLEKAQQIYFSYGITTTQEGLMRKPEFRLLQKASAEGLLRIDVVGYAEIKDSSHLIDENPDYVKKYNNHFKIGGYKLFLDGSPQGCTAWLTQPYVKREGQPTDYCGYAIYEDTTVKKYLQKAEDSGLQLLTHCNGDAAIDQLLNACEKPSQNRNVIIHAQLMRPDQLKKAKTLGFMPSFFAAHTYYWGDTHIKNLGSERAGRISPVASAVRENLPFTLHMDTPVLPPNMLDCVWCTMNRITREGVPLAADEIPSVFEALKGITVYGAYQYFEENEKATLSPYKNADLVVLDRDPTACPKSELKNIQILQTYKDGKCVYQKGAEGL